MNFSLPKPIGIARQRMRCFLQNRTFNLIMRISYFNIFLLTCSFKLFAVPGNAQDLEKTTVSLEFHDAAWKKVFEEVEAQSSFSFVFSPAKVNTYPRINFPKGNYTVKEVIDKMLEGTELKYKQKNRYIIIYSKDDQQEEIEMSEEKVSTNRSLSGIYTISGKITDGTTMQAMPGVNIIVKGTTRGTSSDADGKYAIDVNDNEFLVFSFIGFKTFETEVGDRTTIDVTMEGDAVSLKEVTINGGYYTTTDKMKTGSIVKVTAKEIENQPVTSPLLALQGRVPGVEIMPTSGTPGSAINIRIRGQNSLRTNGNGDGTDGNLPLYIIDGIPIIATPVDSKSISIVKGGFDPLSTLNPANIESIEVLKDADATAIYGSRGANGVILITTKNKAGSDRVNLDVTVYRGIGEIVNRMDMLNREQYLQMIHEAIKNDGGDAQTYYDDPNLGPLVYPDLLSWDTTRFTDWQDLLVGGKSEITDMQVGLSGGSQRTTFALGGAYHGETLLYPGDFGYKRYSGNLSLNHTSSNKKLTIFFSGNYGISQHKIVDSNLLQLNAPLIPPNAPELYNEDGSLNWEINSFGISTWSNPMSWLKTTHESTANNLLSNAIVGYELVKGLTLKTNFGFSNYDQTETLKIPISSIDPTSFEEKVGKSTLNTNQRISWIVEPQVVYNKEFGRHGFNTMIGTTWQQSKNINRTLVGSGYTSDALLGTMDGAVDLVSSSGNTEYRYAALFARIGYNYREKYLLNLTGRRDGSSRFGSGNKFGNFGAIGAAWIFSKESFVESNLPFISFGKLRLSYGTTGNDQIGDSKYLKTYNLASKTYHGTVSFVPTALFNPDYAWEVTKKLETAIELGFLKDRISLEAAWYRNRSSNQLVQYALPATTGFPNVLSNFNATVENSGWEFVITTHNIEKGNLRWTTSLNVSIPQNRLVEFENIEESPYASQYKVGEPLSIQRGYIWTGVNPTTGIHNFLDIDGDGSVTATDQDFTKALSIKYYGGLLNTLNYHGLEISFLVQFSDRLAKTGLISLPGTSTNQQVSVLNRWQKEGDITKVQKFTTGLNGGEVVDAFPRFNQSDGAFENISFIRLKTLAIAYSLSGSFIQKVKLRAARVFIQGQNLFTITDYIGWDPETLNGPPPLRIISTGLQLKF